MMLVVGSALGTVSINQYDLENLTIPPWELHPTDNIYFGQVPVTPGIQVHCTMKQETWSHKSTVFLLLITKFKRAIGHIQTYW